MSEHILQDAQRTERGFVALSNAAHALQRLLRKCDVEINGRRDWDLQVHNPDTYARVLRDGSLGFGETYMEGWWDTKDLDGLLHRILSHRIDRAVHSWSDTVAYLRACFFNLQTIRRALKVAHRHYDLGNDLYEQMLGSRMVYSCGYWESAKTLEQAQDAKLELIFRKLGLKPGMRVLDIGCGFGEALKQAASKYGVTAVGITISERQAEYARKLCIGLPVEIKIQDYRKLDGHFDRIFSVGMFEHVGPKNYRTYMEVVRKLLTQDGLFLLHTIGSNDEGHNADPWMEKYIFPNSALPSPNDLCKAFQDLFTIEDWHNFGADYDPTLLAWRRNFQTNWDKIQAERDGIFYRMWNFYLSAMAAAFRARRTQLWQLVLSPNGVAGGYRRPATL